MSLLASFAPVPPSSGARDPGRGRHSGEINSLRFMPMVLVGLSHITELKSHKFPRAQVCSSGGGRGLPVGHGGAAKLT
jgi:hypothetical protein